MDITYFEEVYSFFFSKITTYDEFMSDDEEENRQELLVLLRTSLARAIELNSIKIDEDMECFSRPLTYLEIEILSMGMVLSWMERKVNNVENFEQFLSTKDYTLHSQANHLKELLAAKDNTYTEFRYLIKRYSMDNFIKKRGLE